MGIQRQPRIQDQAAGEEETNAQILLQGIGTPRELEVIPNELWLLLAIIPEPIYPTKYPQELMERRLQLATMAICGIVAVWTLLENILTGK